MPVFAGSDSRLQQGKRLRDAALALPAIEQTVRLIGGDRSSHGCGHLGSLELAGHVVLGDAEADRCSSTWTSSPRMSRARDAEPQSASSETNPLLGRSWRAGADASQAEITSTRWQWVASDVGRTRCLATWWSHRTATSATVESGVKQFDSDPNASACAALATWRSREASASARVLPVGRPTRPSAFLHGATQTPGLDRSPVQPCRWVPR